MQLQPTVPRLTPIPIRPTVTYSRLLIRTGRNFNKVHEHIRSGCLSALGILGERDKQMAIDSLSQNESSQWENRQSPWCRLFVNV